MEILAKLPWLPTMTWLYESTELFNLNFQSLEAVTEDLGDFKIMQVLKYITQNVYCSRLRRVYSISYTITPTE